MPRITELSLPGGAPYPSPCSLSESSSDVVGLSDVKSSDEVDQKYQEVEDLLLQTSSWKSIKKQCQKYSSVEESEWNKLMCRLEVCVEYSQLGNVSQELALRALYEYKDVCTIFEDVIFSKIYYWDLIKRSILRDQLYVVLRIGLHNSKVPLMDFDCLDASIQKQLQFYQGYVHSMSMPEKYVQSTYYMCRNENCNFGNYYRVVRTFDTEDITNVIPSCKDCNWFMEEDTSHRIFGEMALIKVENLVLLHDKANQAGRTTLLCCKDELISQMKREKEYIFTCILTSSIENQDQILEVVCVSKVTRHCFRPLSLRNLSIIRRIADAYHSSWKLVFCLTKMFAKSIAPGNEYFGIKLILLLSMAQSVSDMNEIITTSICISAGDTRPVNLLMKYAAVYCPYYVYQSSLSNLAISKPRGDGEDLLKEDYLYIFDDIQSCDFDKTEYMFLMRALKSKSVHLDFGLEDDRKSPENFQLQFAARIWASMNHSCKTGRYGQLFDSFNLLFRLDAWELDNTKEVSSTNDVYCCDIVLNDNTPTFSQDQWQEYFDCSRAWKVIFTNDAEKLVNMYCSKRKAICQEINNDFSFPLSLKRTLISMSCSFAKLALSEHVEFSHVIVPIILAEESFLVKTGYSPFHSLLQRDFPVKVMSLFYMPQPVDKMVKFQKKILAFVELN